MTKIEKIVIFGAGDFGLQAYNRYADTCEITAFIDSDPRKSGLILEGIQVCPPAELDNLVWDRVFVASSHAVEIIDQLKTGYNIDAQRIYEVPIAVLHNNRDKLTGHKEALAVLTGLLDRYAIPYWLDHSSLLGLVRDGDPGIIDIDLAVLSEHAADVAGLLKMHYPVDVFIIYPYGFNGDLWCKTDIRQFKLFGYLDIHVKIRVVDGIYWLIDPMLLRSERRFYDGCETAVWNDMKLKLPRDPCGYLSQLYGRWEQPESDWTYSDYANITRVFTTKEMRRATE